MTRLLPAWRASLRLAVRSITRAKGRSALVGVMVGVPVMLTVVIATLAMTSNISPKEMIPSQMGSTQALASYVSSGKVDQQPDSLDTYGDERAPTQAGIAAAPDELARLTDASIIPVRHGLIGLESNPNGAFDVFQADFTRPGTRGLVEVDKGRLPSAVGEATISHDIAKDGPYKIGSTLVLRGGISLKVVGVGNVPWAFGGYEATGLAVMPMSSLPTDLLTSGYLIDRKAPVTRSDIRELNKSGFAVLSRGVINDGHGILSGVDMGAEASLFRIIAAAIMIEVVLLAGPAFAVGVRRQRRELALIAAAGGSPRDIRRVVIAQALVLGFGASIVGAVAGLVVSRILVAQDLQVLADGFGPFDWSPALTVLAVALGSVSAMVAAYAPARQVSREPLPTVLAGRRIEAGSRTGWPIFGLVLALVGVASTINFGRPNHSENDIAVGAILVVVGVVFLTPALIRFVARLAPSLPLPFRLALRDTARHTARSAPAIAAVMAAVAGIVALGIGSSSDSEQGAREYTYAYPANTGVIQIGDDIAQVNAKVKSLLPGRTLTPLLSHSAKQTDLTTPGCPEGGDCYWQGQNVSMDASGIETSVVGSVVAADAGTLKAWGIDLTAAQSSALAAGKGLVQTTKDTGPGQTLNLQSYPLDDIDHSEPAKSKQPIHRLGVVEADLRLGGVPTGAQPQLGFLIVSPQTAKALDLGLTAGIERISGTLTKGQETALKKIVTGDGQSVTQTLSQLDVERGYHSDQPFILLLLSIAGAVAILIGTLSATGLALNDARPDFATLNSIGAAPRTRRVMAAAQALTIGVMGVVLGLLIGLFPGVLAARSLTTNFGSDRAIIDLPWTLFAVLALVVPLLAAGASGLFIRNNAITIRRLAE